MFFCCFASAQINVADTLLYEGYKCIYTLPEESIKSGNFLYAKANDDLQRIDAKLLISKSYFAKGDYNNSIIAAGDALILAKKKSKNEDYTAREAEACIVLSHSFNQIGLDELGNQMQDNVKHIAKKTKNENTLYWLNGSLYLADALDYSKKLDYDAAVKNLLKAKKEFKQSKDKEQKVRLGIVYYSLGANYAQLSKIDSSDYYFKEAMNVFSSFKSGNVWEAVYLNRSSEMYFQDQKYDTAILQLNKSLNIAKKLDHIPLQSLILDNLINNYLAIGDFENFHKINDESLLVNAKFKKIQESSVNTSYNLINNYFESELNRKKSKTSSIIYFGIGITICTFLIGFYVFKQNKNKLLKLDKIRKKIENKENHTKTLIIPEETEKIILDKLTEFESSELFLSKDMSLGKLSVELDTNTKYLSEIINKHKHKHFNNYINELRVKYIIQKLESNSRYLSYKVSYLADEAGFSSHSLFANTFKNLTGKSPSVFIENLIKNKSNSLNE